MLRDLFRHPVSAWPKVLEKYRHLLDDQFFQNVERRIAWGLENNHLDDALRFARVGDTAAKVVGRSSSFQVELSQNENYYSYPLQDPGEVGPTGESAVLKQSEENLYKAVIEKSMASWPEMLRVASRNLESGALTRLKTEMFYQSDAGQIRYAEELALIGDILLAHRGETGTFRLELSRRLPVEHRFSVPMDVEVLDPKLTAPSYR